MKTTSLVLVLSTDGLTGDDAALRTALWSQVSELLQPTLGRVCKRFEPAVEAWRQKIDQDYGILLGRSDPALFLYFYSSGRHRQEEAVQYHLHGMLDSSQVSDRQETETTREYTITPKVGCALALQAHLFWHTSMMRGEILPDSGIYFVPARQACIAESLHDQILGHMDQYALAVVRFYSEVGHVSV